VFVECLGVFVCFFGFSGLLVWCKMSFGGFKYLLDFCVVAVGFGIYGFSFVGFLVLYFGCFDNLGGFVQIL